MSHGGTKLSIPRVLGLALLLATPIGLGSVVLLRLSTAAMGQPVPWSQAASGWIDWYVWAALTPLVVWLARAVPVRSGGWRRAVAAHVGLAVAVGLLELLIFALVMTVYVPLFVNQPLQPLADRYLFLLGRWLPVQMLTYGLIVAVVNVIDIGRQVRDREVRAAKLESELSRAHLHALQAQIQPHFLFNVMNTISMAVREGRSDDAVAMMGHLGGMLRRSVAATDEAETSLENELDFVRHYLRLESCRMEDRLRIEWDVDPRVLRTPVPSMILQPLVENAVRHGLAESPGGGTLGLRVHGTNGTLHVAVEDDGVGLPREPVEGTGLSNVRRRLDTRYGPGATLRLERRVGGGTVTTITLPREG